MGQVHSEGAAGVGASQGPVATMPPHLEPSQLAFHIYFQGWEHGLVLGCQVLEPAGGKPRQPPWATPGAMTLQDPGTAQLGYLLENSSKSARRSQMRRPVRAALEEYVGPMPFLVVPML